ncbi:unnamed protein product [Urochloa humidicola]
MLCVLLVLSSAMTPADAGRQLVVTAAATASTTATTVEGRRLGMVVMREEMDDAVGVGEFKRRSPGGPDPQHH